MIDIDYIEFALGEKREQMKTATPGQLAKLSAECNGLLRVLKSEGKLCRSVVQEPVTDAKPLLPSLVEDVLLALEIPLSEYQEPSQKLETESPQSRVFE